MVKRRTKAEWVEICAAFDASDETVANFSRKRGVSRSLLYGWRKRLTEERLPRSSKAATFVEVVDKLKDPSNSGRVIVRFRDVSGEFDGAPPIEWIAKLAAGC